MSGADALAAEMGGGRGVCPAVDAHPRAPQALSVQSALRLPAWIPNERACGALGWVSGTRRTSCPTPSSMASASETRNAAVDSTRPEIHTRLPGKTRTGAGPIRRSQQLLPEDREPRNQDEHGYDEPAPVQAHPTIHHRCLLKSRRRTRQMKLS